MLRELSVIDAFISEKDGKMKHVLEALSNPRRFGMKGGNVLDINVQQGPEPDTHQGTAVEKEFEILLNWLMN